MCLDGDSSMPFGPTRYEGRATTIVYKFRQATEPGAQAILEAGKLLTIGAQSLLDAAATWRRRRPLARPPGSTSRRLTGVERTMGPRWAQVIVREAASSAEPTGHPTRCRRY